MCKKSSHLSSLDMVTLALNERLQMLSHHAVSNAGEQLQLLCEHRSKGDARENMKFMV